jgi:predicted small metal-binding protein
MDERQIRTRCACGWERTGPVDEVVGATIEHGQRLHNMTATPDQVLAQAESVVDASLPGGAPRGADIPS